MFSLISFFLVDKKRWIYYNIIAIYLSIKELNFVNREENRRITFIVPKEDKSIHKWLEKQINMTFSLRMLIRDTIEKYGYIDYACKNIEKNGD